jgi:hypothetical protein
MKQTMGPEWIALLNDLADKAGCNWYKDNDGNFVISDDRRQHDDKQGLNELVEARQDNDDKVRASLNDSMSMKAHVDQVIMCCQCGLNLALTVYHGNSLCNDCYQDYKKQEEESAARLAMMQRQERPQPKDKPIDEDKYKDLLSQCDYDQKQIIQRFSKLMIDSGIHGTQFGLTVIGAGHEGNDALVTLKVDLFNTDGKGTNTFNQRQINMMAAHRLKMIKLEAPDSAGYFYITLIAKQRY